MSMLRRKAPKQTSWFRGLISRTDPETDHASVITIYQKDIRHYTDAVQEAKRMVDRKQEELATAKENLRMASQEFIEYCGREGLDLPIQMELGTYPVKTYVLEE